LQLADTLDRRREIVVPAVARELGSSVRTVYRDLGVLERVGMPIYQERSGGQARWRVVEGSRRRLAVTLSWAEALALALSTDLIAGSEGAFLVESAFSAVQKVRAALPEPLAARIDAARPKMSAKAGASHEYGHLRESLPRLVDAIDRQERFVLPTESQARSGATAPSTPTTSTLRQALST
jgi:predicted DNA-binding transcriptional regulator YafY